MIEEHVPFIGCHPAILEVLDLVEKIAATATSVLISGESGTGKDQLVRYIHQRSNRADKRLVRLDCGALAPELVENELFGHEPGAFTGAVDAKQGKLELGHGGTVHLDNITSMTLTMQARLTRVIQERAFERLGGTCPIQIDARFIATTPLHPKDAVRKKLLRKDLYFRLNVVSIHLPPLRRRPSDIPLLVKHFLDHYNKSNPRRVLSVDADALRALENYPWPGNVRQLENVLERAAILCDDGFIRAADLHGKLLEQESDVIEMAGHEELTLEELERLYIERILQKTRGNKSKAAEVLGINRKTLLEKRKKYGLP